MDAALAFLEAHGYWLLFGLGFAEFAGVPIASAPVLLAAGALSAAGNLNLLAAAVSAASGGLTADSLWYVLARWKGSRLVDLACSLTSNPTACVLNVSEKLARLGGPYILAAKFIPGAGKLIAPAAGLARLPAPRFLGNLCAGRVFDAHGVSDGGSSRLAGAPCALSVTEVADKAASRRYRAHVAPGGSSRLRRRYRFARANAA